MLIDKTQLVIITESSRVIRKTSSCVFGGAVALYLFTSLPSHAFAKVAQMAIATAMIAVCDRLDKLSVTIDGYEKATFTASEKGYQKWVNKSLLSPKPMPEIESQQSIAVLEASVEVEPISVTEALNKPHIMLLGETGSGKSTLVKYLVSQTQSATLVLDSHAAPDDWNNMDVIGMGRDYKAIGDEVANLVKLMNQRYAKRSDGQKSFEPLIVIIDEFPACVANLGKSFTANIMLLVRESRKVSIRLIILAQGSEVKTLGIEGQGAIRECFAMVYLGKFAKNAAKSLHDEQLVKYVNGLKRPALLDDRVCELPNIGKVNLNILPMPTDYLDLK
jgi:ABC-type cobalamin/Fe3+-siderophores transport system ATPase subunit